MAFTIMEGGPPPRTSAGECLLNGGWPKEALPILEKELADNPVNWAVWNNLGICHKYLGNYEKSIQCLEKSFELNPSIVQSRHNLAMVYEEMGNFELALKHYVTAACYCQNENSQYGMAICLLRSRRYDVVKEIWEQSRLAKHSAVLVPNLQVWRGQDLRGKKLLVIREGGFGDIFWQLRYLRVLKDRGAHITFFSFKAQKSILDGHPWIDALMTMDEQVNEQEFDYQIPLWSIMMELRQLGVEIPLGMDAPYIQVRETLKGHVGLQVGICWKAGEILSVHRPMRAIQDEYLPEFAKVPVDWVSLIPGEKPDWCVGGIEKGADWKRTAEVIAGLDLVVSADTGVAHLAGAMMKPTIVFTPVNTPWFYFDEGDKSSWYPSWTVVRNSEPVSFKPAVEEIVARLTKWVDARTEVLA